MGRSTAVRTAAVLAGGLGTRVAALTGGTLPKPLLPLNGRPFIDYKLDELRRAGVGRVVLLLGAHAEQIVQHVTDGRWGLDVTIVQDGDQLRGTGGALRQALSELPAQFWVTYGDTLLSADLGAAEDLVDLRGWTSAMTVLRNEDRWQPSNVSVDGGLVVAYDKQPRPGVHRFIDYGLLYLQADSFAGVQGDVFDLREVLDPLIAARKLGAIEVMERFHDIGTPEALAETEAWLRSGRRLGV